MGHLVTSNLINMTVTFEWKGNIEMVVIPKSAMRKSYHQWDNDAEWEYEFYSSDKKWLFVYQHNEDTYDEDKSDEIYIREVRDNDTIFYDGIFIDDDIYHNVDIEYNYESVNMVS